jgi:hypothetical protein
MLDLESYEVSMITTKEQITNKTFYEKSIITNT